MKKKKLLIIISVIIVVIISIIYLLTRTLNKLESSLEEIDAYINKSVPNNIYCKKESFDSNNNLFYITEIYVKDEKTYVRRKDLKNSIAEEFWCDYKNNIETGLNHSEDIIKIQFADTGSFLKNPLFDEILDYKGLFYNEFKYIKVLNEKDYTKVLFYYRNDKTCMYINHKDRRIAKVKVYSKYDENDVKQHKYTLNCTDIFSYSYNTVTDEDIPEFDINNYPNYNLIDCTNME